MKLLLCCIFLSAPALAATNSLLSRELETFLGKPPKGFEKNFEKPARQLRTALENRAQEKTALAIQQLLPLAQNSEYAEHATYELALAYREKNEFSKSTAQASRLLYEFPGTVYADRVPDLIRDNDCSAGLVLSDKKATSAKGIPLLFRCLNKTPWKDWGKREAETIALYHALGDTKSNLLPSFVTEAILALPAKSLLRVRITQDFSPATLESYAALARFRAKNTNPPGVKAVYPDADLFDLGIQAALKGNWAEANATFKKFVAEYPQSERIDSAQYWVARTDEKLGNAEAAQKQYAVIAQDGPLTYYGLQSALHLKKDLRPVAAAQITAPALAGALVPRQINSLWRLRALLEQGLIDQAREEARFLFQQKPGGSTFGQESPEGAVMVARLYDAAGYSLAAFAHAYSAISFKPELLEPKILSLIFPLPFPQDFERAGEATGIHPLLLLSVAKQESAFIPNALSRADALGLMQLLPSTATEMKTDLVRNELFDPRVNTGLGAQYLKKLLDRFQGNIALALAAYNAGPTRAQQWQKQMIEFGGMKENFDVELFIDAIPFTETRKYVGSILRNFAWYKLLNNDGTISNVQELAFQWQKPKAPEIKSPETKPEPSETSSKP